MSHNNMRVAGLRTCFALVLLCSSTAHPDSARAIDGGVTDVGPEAGFTPGSRPFLFNGPDEILVLTGRAGVHKTTNGGQSWMRSERGLINTAGVEPNIQSLCQSPSEPQIAYATTIQDGVYRTSNFGESWDASISGGAMPIGPASSILRIAESSTLWPRSRSSPSPAASS